MSWSPVGISILRAPIISPERSLHDSENVDLEECLKLGRQIPLLEVWDSSSKLAVGLTHDHSLTYLILYAF